MASVGLLAEPLDRERGRRFVVLVDAGAALDVAEDLGRVAGADAERDDAVGLLLD